MVSASALITILAQTIIVVALLLIPAVVLARWRHRAWFQRLADLRQGHATPEDPQGLDGGGLARAAMGASVRERPLQLTWARTANAAIPPAAVVLLVYCATAKTGWSPYPLLIHIR